MLKNHQNKSEETSKCRCRFLIKYRIEVKVSWLDTQSTKGKGNTRGMEKNTKEDTSNKYFNFFYFDRGPGVGRWSGEKKSYK